MFRNSIFSDIKRGHVSLTLVSLFFVCIATQVSVAQNQKYPDHIKDMIEQDCQQQPLAFVFDEEFQRIVKPRYCSCYANYIENSIPYPDFIALDSAIKKNPKNIQKLLNTKTQRILQTGFISCYRRVCSRVGNCEG